MEVDFNAMNEAERLVQTHVPNSVMRLETQVPNSAMMLEDRGRRLDPEEFVTARSSESSLTTEVCWGRNPDCVQRTVKMEPAKTTSWWRSLSPDWKRGERFVGRIETKWNYIGSLMCHIRAGVKYVWQVAAWHFPTDIGTRTT